MAQILVRNLDENVKRRLVARAQSAGRSIEEEARRILAAALPPDEQEGLGTRIARLFAESGLTPQEHEMFERAIAEQRAVPARIIDFGE